MCRVCVGEVDATGVGEMVGVLNIAPLWMMSRVIISSFCSKTKQIELI